VAKDYAKNERKIWVSSKLSGCFNPADRSASFGNSDLLVEPVVYKEQHARSIVQDAFGVLKMRLDIVPEDDILPRFQILLGENIYTIGGPLDLELLPVLVGGIVCVHHQGIG
jgi:hypothetical protein